MGFWGESLTVVTEKAAMLLYLSLLNFSIIRGPYGASVARGGGRPPFARRVREVGDQRSELPGPLGNAATCHDV